MRGRRAIQQKAVRQRGVGPAMGKGRIWRMAERMAMVQSRRGISRIDQQSNIALSIHRYSRRVGRYNQSVWNL